MKGVLHNIEDDLGIRLHLTEYGVIRMAENTGQDWLSRLDYAPLEAYLAKRDAFSAFLRARGADQPL